MARSGRTGSGRGRIALIIAVAVAAALTAELAVLVPAPAGIGPAPVAVNPHDDLDPVAIERLDVRPILSPGTPSALPAFALVIGIVAFSLNLAGNQLSRKVEASADGFALQMTGDPRGFDRLQQQLARTSLSDTDPFGPLEAALRTHPAAVQRIGAALAYAEERGIDMGERTFPASR